MTEAARINVVELTVTELSAALKRTVEDNFGYVRLRGEVSGYRGPHSSGHAYFSLKDDNALIEAVIWKMTFGRMKIRPEEGLEVVVTGRVTTFPGRSKYQIVIETLELAGIGALLKQLEERKKKLAAEGLFEEARKQLIPFMPRVVGVVTSPTGAVIRDILHRLADRFPRDVIVWPVRVQGDGAANEIAAAIRGFNALPEGGKIPRPDVLIVARGGGSLEDLWCFNEEIVVRAAADSMIPLISAVGHETDVTLIDFASDRRAPTPTAAAEIAVPVRAELLSRIAALGARQLACWQRGLEIRKRELRSLARALPTPDRLFADRRQRLDNLSERLPRALRANAHVHHRQFSRIAGGLSPQLLRTRLDRCNVLVESFYSRGQRAFATYLARRNDRVRSAGQLLNAFSYRGVLSRGFALVRDQKGVPLRAVAAVTSGMRLDIEFSDGRIGAIADGASTPRPTEAVKDVSKDTSKEMSKPKAKSGGGTSGQGSLF